MTPPESEDIPETAVEYLESVLRYVQEGGKLASIEATVSQALLLHSRELGREGRMLPLHGSLRAAVLRESAHEMRARHNNLNADAVFADIEGQARRAGLIGN